MEAAKKILEDGEDKLISIPNTSLIASVISVEVFEEITGIENESYAQKFLKKAYLKTSGINTTAGLNFMVHNGKVYIIPESGKGFNEDAKHILTAIKLDER